MSFSVTEKDAAELFLRQLKPKVEKESFNSSVFSDSEAIVKIRTSDNQVFSTAQNAARISNRISRKLEDLKKKLQCSAKVFEPIYDFIEQSVMMDTTSQYKPRIVNIADKPKTLQLIEARKTNNDSENKRISKKSSQGSDDRSEVQKKMLSSSSFSSHKQELSVSFSSEETSPGSYFSKLRMGRNLELPMSEEKSSLSNTGVYGSKLQNYVFWNVDNISPTYSEVSCGAAVNLTETTPEEAKELNKSPKSPSTTRKMPPNKIPTIRHLTEIALVADYLEIPDLVEQLSFDIAILIQHKTTELDIFNAFSEKDPQS
eukprot:GHVP01038182.1.p1 GENE.GHVP01038182.1~~GHVP01038182.1.p1  ORF type:complete len:315 (-),score=64.76 GHVP01038182.1:63-1007(-)